MTVLHPWRSFRGAALATVAVLALAAGACSPREEFRGYSLDEARLGQIRAGEQTQNQVVELLGTPSSVSTFSAAGNTWYYISKQTESLAFFAEEVKDQRVVAIDFDDDGRVKDVRRYGLADARAVELVSRETSTRGRELGLVEQLFGNIGRFNNENTRRR